MKKWVFFFLTALQCITLQAEAKSVVCIHGFMTTSRSMRPIADSLRCIGFQVYNWEYPSRRYTIQEHACHLIPYLQEIACCYPGEPIDFVSHSTGALILRAALNLPGCPQEAKIGRAALLAPPNQGSRLAYRFRNFQPMQIVMGCKSGWELMHWDACDIVKLGFFPECMQIFVIAGTRGIKPWFCEPNDGYLGVSETVLETPYFWTSFPVSHGDLLSCPPVLCCLRTFLYWGFPEEPECCTKQEPEPAETDPGSE